MQWLKERTSFIIGSDRWMGGQGGSSSSQSSIPSDMPSPAPPNGVTQYNPLSGIRVRSPTRDELLDKASPPHSKLYPDVYKGDESSESTQETKVQASEEVLVRIPGAMAHLIDDEESVLLASGEFCLVKLSQNGTDVAMFARVGDDLQWPLVKDEPATKLDPSHYVFSLRVDPDDDEEKSSKGPSSKPETLSYGVTFKVVGNKEMLQELDKLLQHYSYFSAPQVLQASDEDLKTRDISADSSGLAVKGKPVSTDVVAEQKPSVESSVAFWTTIAPNVNDYNSSLARGIASGTGQIIRGILWCSDTTVSQLKKGGHSGVCSKPSEVSPTTLRNIRRAKRVTKMSEKVAKGVLTGVVTVTGFFTTSVVNSKVGKKFFKTMPGEVALASLEAFGKIFDAVEVAGTNVLNTTSVVTTGAINNRYGDQAAEAAHESFATAGHLFSTAWTISKLRNAFNPKNAIKPSAVLRQAAKAAGKKT